MKKQVKKAVKNLQYVNVISVQQQKQLKGGDDDLINNPSGFIGDDDILGG